MLMFFGHLRPGATTRTAATELNTLDVQMRGRSESTPEPSAPLVADIHRAVALCRVDCDGAVSPSGGECVRRLAQRGPVASPLLSDGSLPAMAQLAGADPGSKRLLSCGCCCTRWQFTRTGCPFCDTDSQRLTSLAIEAEAGLRIDHCKSCGCYLKTYDGQGHETCFCRTGLHFIWISSRTIAH
jgi:hypothetical protein